MNRLLPFICYILIACLPASAQVQKLFPHDGLRSLLTKESADEQDIKALVVWGEEYINRPGIEKKDVDSAFLCANKITNAGNKQHNLIWQAQACVIYSKVFRETDNKAKGWEYILKAKKIFDKHQHLDGMGDVYLEMALYKNTADQQELKEKIGYYEAAVKLFEKSGNKFRQSQALYQLADHLLLTSDPSRSIIYANQAINICNEIGYTALGACYDVLSVAYNEAGDLGKALSYALLSLKDAEERKDSSQTMSTAYNRLGMLYYELEDYNRSITYYHKGLKLASMRKDTVSMQYLTGNIANSYFGLKKPAEGLKVLRGEAVNYPPAQTSVMVSMLSGFSNAYLLLKQYDSARVYIDKLQGIRSTLEKEEAQHAYILAPLIRYSLAVKQYEKARTYCAEMDVVLKKHNVLPHIVKNYALWFKADSSLGDYPAAIRHYQLYKYYNDSLFNIAKAQQINQLQVTYETEQKDQALKLKQQNIELLTREGQLQKSELHSARFARNMIIAGAGMMALLLLLGYNRYQLKLRSNKQLKHQQDEINRQNHSLQSLIDTQDKLLEEKEWLVKEIHHRVKNNLQIVMSLLNTQAAFLDDKDALDAIRESRFRMQAISLIHQKLYQSENMAFIDIRNYIHELIVYLKEGFEGVQRINFDLQIAPMRLDVSQSVPIGLILNEAITNAIKYAFSGSGTIIVSLQQTGIEELTLIIADNGKGLGAEVNRPLKKSMGMMLMRTLSEQLEGTLDIQSRHGVTVTVTFKFQQEPDFTTSNEVTDYV